MDCKDDVLSILDELLSLKGRAKYFTFNTRLLGAMPELDQFALGALFTALEDRFGFQIDDDELDRAIFATVGSLVKFVENKMARQRRATGGPSKDRR